MKKKNVLLLLAAGLGLFFFVKQVPFLELPGGAGLASARPLLWLDDRFLLIGQKNKIIKYDTLNRVAVKDVFEPYYPGAGHECFSSDGAEFPIEKARSMARGPIIMNDRFGLISDWNKPELSAKLKIANEWDINPHDCSHSPYKPETMSTAEVACPQLLKSKDGKTKCGKLGMPGERIVRIEKDNQLSEIKLNTDPLFGRMDKLKSFFDRASGKYLWYLSTNDFNPRHWPMTAWWVTADGKVASEVTIPAGPWVRKIPTWEAIQYFSCGASCYTDMEMFAGNGQIYIYVWGRAVKGTGVYRLNPEKQTWKKIIKGEVDNGLVISPNGRRLSFSANGKLRIKEV